MLYFILIIFILCPADSLTTCFVVGGGGSSDGFVVVSGGWGTTRFRGTDYCPFALADQYSSVQSACWYGQHVCQCANIFCLFLTSLSRRLSCSFCLFNQSSSTRRVQMMTRMSCLLLSTWLAINTCVLAL